MATLTVNQRHKVRFLILSAIDVRHRTDELVHLYVVGASLNVQLQVLSFVAEELTPFDDNANLLRQPVWDRPELL